MPLLGVVPIIVIPFQPDNRIAWAELEREIAFALESGASGVAYGFASEIECLDDEERRQVVSRTRTVVGQHVPIVFSTRNMDPTVLPDLATPVDYLMVTPPAEADTALLVRYYREQAAVGPTVMMQDAPELSGVTLTPEQIDALAREVPIRCWKLERSPTPRHVARLRHLDPGANILGGLHGLWLPEELQAGADGTMPAAAYCDLHVKAYRRWHASRQVNPADFQALGWLNRYVTQSFAFALLCQKELLRLRGIFTNAPRLRLTPDQLESHEHETLARVWQQSQAMDSAF